MTGPAVTVALSLLWGVVLAAAVDRAVARYAPRALPLGAVARHLVVAGRRPRVQRRRDGEVVEQLPDVVDLLRLTTMAGLPVPLALTVVGDRPGGPVGQAFCETAVRLRRGAAMAEVLPRLAEACGRPARSLVDALADHDRYGTALGPSLDRLAVESRLKRRRQAEEAARRLPVLLLFPLVLTTLPAFLLLAVVPLVAGSLSSLQP